jgi:hypothetical protein
MLACSWSSQWRLGWIGIQKVIVSVTVWERKVGTFRIHGKVSPALFVLYLFSIVLYRALSCSIGGLFMLSFSNSIKVFARYNIKLVIVFKSVSFQFNEVCETVAITFVEFRS